MKKWPNPLSNEVVDAQVEALTREDAANAQALIDDFIKSNRLSLNRKIDFSYVLMAVRRLAATQTAHEFRIRLAGAIEQAAILLIQRNMVDQLHGMFLLAGDGNVPLDHDKIAARIHDELGSDAAHAYREAVSTYIDRVGETVTTNQ